VADIPARIVRVEIHGQKYPIRSALDERYIAELAHYVDEKIRVAAEATPTGDSLRIAVLAALNIADEFFRCRTAEQMRAGQLAARAQQIERLLDQALAS
jgi:cell division protein ZapA